MAKIEHVDLAAPGTDRQVYVRRSIGDCGQILLDEVPEDQIPPEIRKALGLDSTAGGQ
jgi:hypothetical protein